jgi:hypothetical protein
MWCLGSKHHLKSISHAHTHMHTHTQPKMSEDAVEWRVELEDAPAMLMLEG